MCQAEMVKEFLHVIMESDIRPERKTDRDGGFGSTGKE
jgi:dUTPase